MYSPLPTHLLTLASHVSRISCPLMRFLYYLQELHNRRTQFQNGVLEWSSTCKDRVKFILGEGLPYVSSEELGEEDDRPVYFRQPLTWLKSKYRKFLHYLDKLSYQSLSAKSKQMYRIRCDGDASQRSPPALSLIHI